MDASNGQMSSPSRRIGVWAAVASALLVVLAACGGGDANDSPDTTVVSKGAPLNSCTNVVSGARPAPGVTLPRCAPTTIKAATTTAAPNP